MKIWIDDLRPAPAGYKWIKSVNEAKNYIERMETESRKFLEEYRNAVKKANTNTLKDTRYILDFAGRRCIEVIDMDHDAGDYATEGGDYIKLLDWLEEQHYNIPIHIHSMNPVGVANMRRIIQRNSWTEI